MQIIILGKFFCAMMCYKIFNDISETYKYCPIPMKILLTMFHFNFDFLGKWR
jgi:hypothetical protein